MTSMRRQLLLYLMSALLAGSIVSGYVTYLSTRDEINEVFDNNFVQIARILEQQKNVIADSKSVVSDRDALKGEEEFLIQIWSRDMRLIYTTHPRIQLPGPAKSEFETRDFNNEEWRSFSTAKNDLIVQVSQPASARRRMILEITINMLIPILLQFPILALLMLLVVGRSLDSLAFISRGLQKRSEKSLQPLAIDGIPVEIIPLVNALNDLLARLDNAMGAQRKFTADAAHELRTPLTAVQLQLELLGRTKNEVERQEAAGNLALGVKRSIRLVEQLLSLARLESEVNIRSAVTLDAVAFCREAVKVFSERAIQKNIDLGLIRQEPAYLSSTAEGLHTVVSNLIDNAIRYTPDGGRIDVSVYAVDGCAVIEVSDDGAGIPPAEQARIFDRFYRVPGNATQGTGLGLAIVKSVLDSDRAAISINRGIDGKGTTFKIIYPKVSG